MVNYSAEGGAHQPCAQPRKTVSGHVLDTCDKPIESARAPRTTVLDDDKEHIESVSVYARQNINDIDVRSKTGQVETVDMQIVKSKPTTNIALALQGTVPRLVVTNVGELGSEPTVRVRGNSSLSDGNLPNEPLYVLDGKVISPQTFYELNPADISKISVLKDAVATALYGIKAANLNGVGVASTIGTFSYSGCWS